MKIIFDNHTTELLDFRWEGNFVCLNMNLLTEKQHIKKILSIMQPLSRYYYYKNIKGLKLIKTYNTYLQNEKIVKTITYENPTLKIELIKNCDCPDCANTFDNVYVYCEDEFLADIEMD